MSDSDEFKLSYLQSTNEQCHELSLQLKSL